MSIHYVSANDEYLRLFGHKTYRIALHAGTTCPTRDGTLGVGGCIFCSRAGSGDFASDATLPIVDQVRLGKELVRAKAGADARYIAYFQAFTSTYGDEEELRMKYNEAIAQEDIVGIAIATRPDCISNRMLEILEELTTKTHVWVELGLQSIHETSEKWMRRGYPLSCFEEMVARLEKLPLDIVVHVILNLLNETEKMMTETIDYVAQLPIQGIKIANLHILSDSDLGKAYVAHPFPLLGMDEYIDLLSRLLPRIPRKIVVYRLTGDGPKATLLAPLWTANKRQVRNAISKAFREKKVIQGSLFSEGCPTN